MRDRRPGAHRQYQQEIALFGLAVHRPGQRQQQIENRVEEYRYREHESARHQRDCAALLAQQADEHAHDPVGRPAFDKTPADDRGQRDDNADFARCVAELDGHAGYFLGKLPRSQETDHNRSADKRDECVYPKHDDHPDDDGDPDT
jgi:hypothetical protein